MIIDTAYDADLRLWAMLIEGTVIGYARSWRAAITTLVELVESCTGWR